MVKPLNQEWQLFGQRYRVEGAKGDKVDCNACHKRVSAAVNRLQSHLRNCPARSLLPAALINALGAKTELQGLNGGHVDKLQVQTELSGAAVVSGDVDSSGSVYVDAQAFKRQRLLSPGDAVARASQQVRATATSSSIDELLTGLSPSPSLAAHSNAYTKRRLEIEEKRLELELKREQREARREQLELDILETKARREQVELKNAEANARLQRIQVEKESYESKVMLALSRKQLQDQGVAQDEIDRILPILTAEDSLVPATTVRPASAHPGASYSIVNRSHHNAAEC